MKRRNLLTLVLLVFSAAMFSVAAYRLKTSANFEEMVKPFPDSDLLQIQVPAAGNITANIEITIPIYNYSRTIRYNVYYVLDELPALLIKNEQYMAIFYNNTYYYCILSRCVATSYNLTKLKYNVSKFLSKLTTLIDHYKDQLSDIKVTEKVTDDYVVYNLTLDKNKTLKLLGIVDKAFNSSFMTKFEDLLKIENVSIVESLTVKATKDTNELKEIELKITVSNETSKLVDVRITAHENPTSKKIVINLIEHMLSEMNVTIIEFNRFTSNNVDMI
jgi:hypothetical protein